MIKLDVRVRVHQLALFLVLVSSLALAWRCEGSLSLEPDGRLQVAVEAEVETSAEE